MQRSPAYTLFYGFRVTGDLDVDRLATTAYRLAAALPLLRAVLDGSPVRPRSMSVLPETETFVDHGAVGDAAAFLSGLASQRVRLTRGPLFQVGVARHGDDHIVSMMWHHAIVDAWSVSLCMRWFGQLYADAGGPPDGAVRWDEFVRHEEKALAAADDPGRYWLNQYQGTVFAAPLRPTSRPGTGSAEILNFDVAAPGFPAQCRAVGATPGTVLLTAATLACVELGDRPVTVASMIANRQRPFMDTFGLMIRTVLLREEPLGTRRVGDARRSMQLQLSRCWRHRHESLQLLAERDPDAAAALASGPPPFFVQLLNVPDRELSIPGCRVERIFDATEHTIRFGLELHLKPREDGGIEGTFIFDNALYRRPDVMAAADRYRAWVALLVDPAAADQPLASMHG